ncbi:NAD-dependent epimerase/dehydratase family protein [Arthrobacter roseus]|uniref:NAD-dependent epimerase/dehydratase family protein n=1 Tax=Arthrobacter roseus TaxID=136274 RepID=UPI001965FDBF|nr:NAD-dependent epimerase/dehydratase family protein [Arthrobacter roseus]MBM7846995.1 nucleoside-diphosphate-sugar epimerase [Arthrobacter roseus]
MRLLILGGTAWLGYEVARQVLERRHEVTCLARGEAGPVPTGASLLKADRDEEHGLERVAHSQWDAVLDVARQPGQVKRAVRDLRSAGNYVFVSSGNVYADQGPLGQDEDAPLLAPIESDVMETMDSYGPAKVACEQAVLESFGPEHCLIASAGLIGGPGDTFGRTGYWPLRFAHPSVEDGSVLIPDAPSLPTQIIDVRDFASWLIDCCEQQLTGVYNAMGDTHLFNDHLAAAQAVAAHQGPLVRAETPWLREEGVSEWSGPKSLPLWLADKDWWGMNARSNERAKAAGLTLRPLEETLRAVLAWEENEGIERQRNAGLSRKEEAGLLSALTAR